MKKKGKNHILSWSLFMQKISLNVLCAQIQVAICKVSL